MKSNNIHIGQVSFFQPILEELSNIGINKEKIITKSGLNRFSLDSTHNYVPISLIYNVLTELRQDGIDDSLSIFNTVLQAQSLGVVGESICYTPNLYEACRFTEQFNELLLSNEKVRLTIDNNTATFETWFTDTPKKGWIETEIISLAYVINGFKIGGGKNWVPDEIHLRSGTMPNLDVLFPSNNSIIVKLKQPTTKLIFKTGLLSNPMLLDTPEHRAFTHNFALNDSGYAKVSHLISSVQNGYVPTISEIASYSDMSVSTLKRGLTSEGYSYKEIIDNWRFKKALCLLENPRLKIAEISQILGYANTPNFQRAFKRWTSSTPNNYRLAL